MMADLGNCDESPPIKKESQRAIKSRQARRKIRLISSMKYTISRPDMSMVYSIKTAEPFKNAEREFTLTRGYFYKESIYISLRNCYDCTKDYEIFHSHMWRLCSNEQVHCHWSLLYLYYQT